MGFLDHKALKISMGFPPAPGDTKAVEAQQIHINLMDNSSGIALNGIDGWSPKIPSIENNGIWADSPLSPGRTLLVGEEGNVTETMHIIITGSSLPAMIKTLDSLYAMAENARRFWTDNSQIQPVYLHWWASCGAGSQFSRIFNIAVDPVFLDSPRPAITATLVIEREPFWPVLPPGANPKQWRYEFYNQAWNSTHATIDENQTDDLLIATGLSNQSEFGATYGSLRSNNCIVIPANLIPGDVPAVLEFYTKTNSNVGIIAGLRTNKVGPLYNTGGTIQLAQNTTLNACDGITETDAILAADTGGVNPVGGGGTAQRAAVSFATATNALRLRFSTPAYLMNRFIGRWAIYMRSRQSAGSVGDISMYLRVGTQVLLDTDGIKLQVVSPSSVGAGTGNTTTWGFDYMGVVTLPLSNAKGSVDKQGLGLSNGIGNGNSFDVGLFASRSTGTGVLYICDLVFIPIDEGVMTIDPSDGTLAQGILYDETSFFTHGIPDILVSKSQPENFAQLAMMTGTGIQLKPNVENRIYFAEYTVSGTTKSSAIGGVNDIHMNWIPRFRGVRDIGNVNG